jgi:hypothetical protein
MAVRYFCDRCGNETGPGELRQAELSLPPDPDVTLDLCPSCATDVRGHLFGDAPGTARLDAVAAEQEAS